MKAGSRVATPSNTSLQVRTSSSRFSWPKTLLAGNLLRNTTFVNVGWFMPLHQDLLAVVGLHRGAEVRGAI